MYIHRHAEKSIEILGKMFSSVLVSGPRQVGKTTLLKHILSSDFRYVTMDDSILRMSAKTNPITFLKNLTKRAVKTPKIYFCDTGLAAYLSKWNNPEVLKNGAMAGAYFENFVIMEILKSYYNKGITKPPFYYYRNKEQAEIDLLIKEGNTLYPIEIKKHADPSVNDLKNFHVLDRLSEIKRGTGGIVCLYENLVSLTDKDKIIPVSYL